MKKVENLSIDVKAFIKEEEIPFTTNPKGLDFLMGIFGSLEIPFQFKNAEYKSDEAWLDGNKIFETIKKFNFEK